ncbi:MAG: restriction endonuclease, partial [Desulfobacterales bacterium]|nr:restriction endonuclease [Desulfobacterales bacterium]
MPSNKITSFAPVISVSVIIIVTGLAYISLSSSRIFTIFLAAIFIISAIQALFTIHAENQKGKKNRSQAVSDDNQNEPEVNWQENNEQNVGSSISLAEYLTINNFQLTQKIIDAIEWKRYELLCHLVLKASGYRSQLTGNGADEGVDIRIFDDGDRTKAIYLVQCKKWHKNRKVKREHIQQLRGQMATENVDKGGYCATSGFTKPAREYAMANNIELFDQHTLTKSFNELKMYDRQLILRELLDGDYWTPSCPSCGEKFAKIRQKNGKMKWGCKKVKAHGWTQMHYY